MTEKEKIKLYLEAKNISKNEFYRQTGFSSGFLDSGNTLGADRLKPIFENYPDLSIAWLLFDEGDMIADNSHFLKQDKKQQRIGSDKQISIDDKEDNSNELLIKLLYESEMSKRKAEAKIKELEAKLEKFKQ